MTGTSKRPYQINYGSRLKVTDGQMVEAGDELIDGSINPHDLLRILGVKAVQDYLLREVLSVYRQQGVNISDKHIEIIVAPDVAQSARGGQRRYRAPARCAGGHFPL